MQLFQLLNKHFMKNKKTLIIIFVVILITTTVLFVFFRQNDIIRQNKLSNYLFNEKIESYELLCYNDLIGLSIDGAVFDFYKYQLNDNIAKIDTGNYPDFNSVFIKDILSNIEFLHWQHTPVINDIKNSPLNIALFSNLREHKCSNSFLVNNYLEKEGSFYSYFSAYPIGIYLFIYSPKEKLLYIIHKKG